MSSSDTEWTDRLAIGSESPIAAPPSEHAAATLPSRTSAHSFTGVISVYTASPTARHTTE